MGCRPDRDSTHLTHGSALVAARPAGGAGGETRAVDASVAAWWWWGRHSHEAASLDRSRSDGQACYGSKIGESERLTPTADCVWRHGGKWGDQTRRIPVRCDVLWQQMGACDGSVLPRSLVIHVGKDAQKETPTDLGWLPASRTPMPMACMAPRTYARAWRLTSSPQQSASEHSCVRELLVLGEPGSSTH